MLLKRKFLDSYANLNQKITKELIQSLQRKGVQVASINIDLKPGNVSLSLAVSEK